MYGSKRTIQWYLRQFTPIFISINHNIFKMSNRDKKNSQVYDSTHNSSSIAQNPNISITINKIPSQNIYNSFQDPNMSFGSIDSSWQGESSKKTQGLINVPQLTKMMSKSSQVLSAGLVNKSKSKEIEMNQQAAASDKKNTKAQKQNLTPNMDRKQVVMFQKKMSEKQTAIIKTQNKLVTKQNRETSKPRKLSFAQKTQTTNQKELQSSYDFLKQSFGKFSEQNSNGIIKTPYFQKQDKNLLGVADTSQLYERTKSQRGQPSSNKDQAGSNRMKLRDYLYMTKKSSQNARQIGGVQSKQAVDTTINQLLPPPTILKQSKSQTEIAQASPLYRKSSNSLKYQISNSEMFVILKKQILSDIKLTQQYLNRTMNIIEQTEAQQIPSNDQLLKLYKMRREIKDQILKRSAAIEAFAKQQPKKDTEMTEKQHSQQQRKINQFLRQNI